MPSINNGDSDKTEVGATVLVFGAGIGGIRVFGFTTGTLVGGNDDDMLREEPVPESTGVWDATGVFDGSLILRGGKKSFGIAPSNTQTGGGYGKRSEDGSNV